MVDLAGGVTRAGPSRDAFALGVVLFEMPTGRKPFPGDDILQVLDRNRIVDAVPLVRDPSDRLHTMQDAADILAAAVPRETALRGDRPRGESHTRLRGAGAIRYSAELRNYLKTSRLLPTDEAFDTIANHTQVESDRDN